MEHTMLVTIRHESRMNTLSLATSRQSLVWLGACGETSPRNAFASVELTYRGLLIRTVHGVLIRIPGKEATMEGPLLVDADASAMVGLIRPDDSELLGLFVRPFDQNALTRAFIVMPHGSYMDIGRGQACSLRYGSTYVSTSHARISCEREGFYVQDLRSGNGTFVNCEALSPYQLRALEPGDVVQIQDLSLVVGRGFLATSLPAEVSVAPMDASRVVAERELAHVDCRPVDEDVQPTFYPAPLLTESLAVPSLSIDSPPERSQREDRPLVLQVGPSFLMGLGSVSMGGTAVFRLIRGDFGIDLMPSICMALALFVGMVVWPFASAIYGRKQERMKELVRRERYVAYLDDISDVLSDAVLNQERFLRSAYRPVEDLLDRARRQSPLLMSHANEGEDFLRLRVGIGNRNLEAHIEWPEQHFLLQRDVLWTDLAELRQSVPELRGVPVTIDLMRSRVMGIVGERLVAWEFLRGLLVQVCALYSYEEVRIACICDEDTWGQWEPFAYVPHAYDNANVVENRLCALTVGGAERLDSLISHSHDSSSDHYVVACSNPVLLRRTSLLKSAQEQDGNVSLVFVSTGLHDLPRECELMVELGNPSDDIASEGGGRLFMRADTKGTSVSFEPDIMVDLGRVWDFALDLSRIRVGSQREDRRMGGFVGFLELLEAGNVSHLAVRQRWASADPSRTLSVPVGMGPDGSPVSIDLHERADGPHALVAGMTGSGKSEFIATLVLSLSVCHSPEEVSFLLIDYKGGGLAGAFANGSRSLPHVSGTITNLDGRSISRALLSLRSELIRRQKVLRSTRELVGEATMDIHRHLALYRQGVVEQPLSHLFVIADEFAELRQQEPAFMDELMSAARIGRSLGIHLILATQKPSGVVNDQIWSNARLKVSLKVADAADSREMLRRDDAASLTHPGSFIALVGYDETLWEGQAAYAGCPYVPCDSFEPRQDDAVYLVSKEGQVIDSLRPISPARAKSLCELDAVVDELARVASERGVHARALWLEPLPQCIPLEDLRSTYGSVHGTRMTALVGEIDDPSSQKRLALAIDLRSTANVLFYGIQGSGAEGMLRLTIVSLAQDIDASGLWVYVLDGGEGLLRPLAGLPHVGGLVCPGDDDGVFQLFRVIEAELERRRRNHAHGMEPATMILAIANLEAFVEAHPSYEERLGILARDGARLGLHVLAVADGVASVHGRLRTHFDLVLPTILGDEADYAYLFGGLCAAVPPKQWRRGLVRVDDQVLEFQGATFGEDPKDENRLIDEFIGRFEKAEGNVVPRVPTLPEHVYAEHLTDGHQIPWLPVGLVKRNVEPMCHPLERGSALLVVANDGRRLESYVRGVCDVLRGSGVQAWCVMDAMSCLGQKEGDEHVWDMDETLHALRSDVSRVKALDLVVVMGAPQTMGELPAEAREVLEQMLTSGRSASGPSFVLSCESWRLSGLYDTWYRAASWGGRVLWAGEGFLDQTLFRVPHDALDSQRSAQANDGVLVESGAALSVRLLEGTSGDAR